MSACKEVAAYVTAVVGGEEGQGLADAFGISQVGAGVFEIERLALRLCRLAHLPQFQFSLDAAGTDDVDADALVPQMVSNVIPMPLTAPLLVP